MDGTIKNLRGIGKPVIDKEHKVIGIHGCVQDITGHKKTEAALKSSEEHCRQQLFNGIQESFIVHEIMRDKNGRIADLRFLEINSVTEKIFRKERNEIAGRCETDSFFSVTTVINRKHFYHIQ